MSLTAEQVNDLIRVAANNARGKLVELREDFYWSPEPTKHWSNGLPYGREMNVPVAQLRWTDSDGTKRGVGLYDDWSGIADDLLRQLLGDENALSINQYRGEIADQLGSWLRVQTLGRTTVDVPCERAVAQAIAPLMRTLMFEDAQATLKAVLQKPNAFEIRAKNYNTIFHIFKSPSLLVDANGASDRNNQIVAHVKSGGTRIIWHAYVPLHHEVGTARHETSEHALARDAIFDMGYDLSELRDGTVEAFADALSLRLLESVGAGVFVNARVLNNSIVAFQEQGRADWNAAFEMTTLQRRELDYLEAELLGTNERQIPGFMTVTAVEPKYCCPCEDFDGVLIADERGLGRSVQAGTGIGLTIYPSLVATSAPSSPSSTGD